MTAASATCPWCSALRDSGPTCPKCGADYAKAEAIKVRGRAAPVVEQQPAAKEPNLIIHADDEANEWRAVRDPQLELKFCIAAIPAALLAAIAIHAVGVGAMLQRMAFTMPVHELGHAVSGWLCGFTSIPTLWKTLIPETRGFIAPVLLAGAIGFMMFRAWQTHRQWPLYLGAALLVVQALGTFVIKLDTAHMLITFGGDGMGMIIATLLMASFFWGKHTQLYKGSLRWGFVVIGAAAFIDIYATWWKSRRDHSAIPYGTMDGMASDSMKLVDQHGWTLDLLVQRYFMLGLVCLIALACVYAWGVWHARQERDARTQEDKRRAWENRKRPA